MNASLYVPIGTSSKYKTTDGWKDFVWLEEGVPSGIDGVNTDCDDVEVARYTIDGKRLLAPEKGINIIKKSNGNTEKVLVR